MSFDRNSPAFAHHNSSTRITVEEGPNKNRSLGLNTYESIKMDPGGKPKAVPGASSGPLTTISGAAEPTWDMKLSSNIEAVQLAKLLGNIHTHFKITTTYKRTGLKRVTYRAYGCLPKAGLGFDSSHDNGVTDNPSGICSDITVQEEGGPEFSIVHADSQGGGGSLSGGSGALGINVGISIGF